MKNLNLENLGVQELNSKEMEVIDGGIIPLIVGIGFGLALLLWPKDAH